MKLRVTLTVLFIMLALVSMTKLDVNPPTPERPAYGSLVTRSVVPSAGIWCVMYTGLDSGLPEGLAFRCGASYLSPARVQYSCAFNLPPAVTGFPRWANCGLS